MAARFFLCLWLGIVLAGCATREKTPPPSAVPSAPAPTPAPAPSPANPKARQPWKFSLASLSPGYWISKLKKPGPPAAEPARFIGTITMVNRDDHFVLIDAVSYSSIEPGDALISIAQQRESATLHLSALRKPPFLIADIANGNPAPGDKVYKP